jgi:teichuronic acid biosynthesis glycosyltransferase TuaG
VNSDCIKISVVIPTYNAESYIERTIESILGQSYTNFELILVDDCSNDDTWKIISSFSAKNKNIQCIRLDKNSGGPARPRNIGIKNAKSNLIAFCDADDLWHPIKLESQLNILQRKKANLVCTQIVEFNQNDILQTVLQPIYLDTISEIGYCSTFLKDRIATSSVLCKKVDVIEVGGFDEAKSLVAVEDYDLWLRLLELPNYRAIKMHGKLVRYRNSEKSLSAGKFQHSFKVMNVLKRASVRNNFKYKFIIFFPVFYLIYAFISLYTRVLSKKI